MIQGKQKTVSQPPLLLRRKPAAARRASQFINQLESSDRRFHLRKTLEIAKYRADRSQIHECRPLFLLGYGRTEEESWRSFVQAFECQWDSIAQERNSRLTPDAQELKRKLLDLVESVEPIA